MKLHLNTLDMEKFNTTIYHYIVSFKLNDTVYTYAHL